MDAIIAALGAVGVIALILLFILIQIFYLLSLYTAMELIPYEKRVFPSWFVWLMIIPIVGFIFAWIMEPFGIPRSFEAAAGDNKAMQDASKTLFGLGLAHVILLTIWFIPIISIVSGIAAFVIWIIYWVKIVNFKKTFLQNPLVQKSTSIESD